MSCNSCGRCNSCNSCGGCGRRGCNCLANDIERLIKNIRRDAEKLEHKFDELEDRDCIRGTNDNNNGCGCNNCGCNSCRRCNNCGCNRCGCNCCRRCNCCN